MDGTPVRSEYAGAGVSSDVKEYAAEVALALQGQGWTVAEIVDLLSRTSYAPKQRTLELHLSKLKRGDTPTSSEKGSGRNTKLSEEQWKIVAGWILSREEPLDLAAVCRWIFLNFGITVDTSTVSRHKKHLGLSFQLFGSRPMPAGTTRDEYVIGYFNFLKELNDSGFFAFDMDKIVCVDSLTNSQRVERARGINFIGGKQRKLARSAPQYTNNYVVGVTLSGQLLQVLMFTHDPAFEPNGSRWEDVKRWCAQFRVKLAQIYYTRSTKKYCQEQQAHITAFHQVNRDQLLGARILHDGGGAYKIDGEYILDDGANLVLVLPSAQHGELSPLDNKLNAVAKLLWKQRRTGKDHAYDAFLLLVCIMQTSAESIRSWWTQNFLLDAKSLTLGAVEEALAKKGGKTPIRQALADEYLHAYGMWAHENVEHDIGMQDDEPDQGLNGDYWK